MIPLANPAFITPTTATASRSATEPSSSAEKPSITGTERAFSTPATLSKLFCDASFATSASLSFPRFAASFTCCTPTTASRPRRPRPTRPRTFRFATSLVTRPCVFRGRSRQQRRHRTRGLAAHPSRSSRRPLLHRLLWYLSRQALHHPPAVPPVPPLRVTRSFPRPTVPSPLRW